MVLDLALVGTGGMLPLPNRWLSSVLLRLDGRLALFDCGEGTQISLHVLAWGLQDLDLVLISHLHGDHIGGLPGLLLTQGNSGRTEPVDILGPPGLTATVVALRTIAPNLPFEVRCRDLDPGATFEFGKARGTTAGGDHALPCLAYRLDVPRQPRFLFERAEALGLPRALWSRLQRGEPVDWGGRRIDPGEVLGPERRGVSLALVTDTRPTAELTRFATGVDLLVCEGTYGSDEDRPKAVQRKHMTFSEAAGLARAAGARRLVLTHFSPALADPAAFAETARGVFPKTVVGHDHWTTTLRFPDD